MRTSSCTGKHSEPTRSPDGSGVNREVHAPFCERPGVKSLWPTHPPMRVLDPGRGRTRVCQFWAHATDDRSWQGPAPPAVAYIFAGSRGKKEIQSQLADFEGVCHVDGYVAYDSLVGDEKMPGKIRLAYCLVHARRNFVKVHKTT